MEEPGTVAPKPTYPARLDIDYPEQLDRLTTFFRLILVIPIFIILMLLFGGTSGEVREGSHIVISGGGIVVVPTLLMILFRKKYPRWWFDWNLELTRFANRVVVYILLLRDEYPSTDDEQAVHIEIDYPDAERELGRGMPLVKWLLALPHWIILYFLFVAVVLVTVFAWFAILFTGRYPRSVFDFVVGFLRWALRVEVYALLLTTDEYPTLPHEERPREGL